jgi:hypothetical protein
LNRRIKRVQKILFEWWPEPKGEFLNDNTAFDSYMEYIDENDACHAVGIEFKYTEREYEYGKKEKKLLFEKKSIYWKKAKLSKLYKPNSYENLRSKPLKQMFRNHLLGNALILSNQLKHLRSFTSVLIYPADNTHIAEYTKKYQQLLTPENDLAFIPVTFEKFISTCEKCHESEITAKWLQYLKVRYIISNE